MPSENLVLPGVADPDPRKILRSDPAFVEGRSAAVLATCEWLCPIMNRVHETDFSKAFWTRALTDYVFSAYNQRKHYQQNEFDYPIPFQPINGWTPPLRKTILKNKVITILRALRGTYHTSRIPESGLGFARIALGVRAEHFCEELNATPLSFNWLSCIRRSDKQARNRLALEAQEISDTERRNILIGMPRIYIEHLQEILEASARVSATPVKDIFVEHYGSIFEKILAAYLAENGALIYQLQPGAFVGETRNSVLPVNRFQYDRQLTYGWTESKKDFPYYAVRLEEFSTRYQAWIRHRPDIDLLVVFGSAAATDQLRNYYQLCTLLLSKTLNRSSYPNILLRPRAQSRVLRLADIPHCFKQFKPAEIDQGHTDIARLCGRSRIVVHWMMPSTNFLECIFVDQPVVAVDTNFYATEIIKPYYDAFKKLDILHEDPKSLIRFLNGVNLEEWWKNVCSSEAYIEFKSNFARSRRQYMASSGPKTPKTPKILKKSE